MSEYQDHIKVPLPSLHLWLPPLRLFSACMWQVIQQRQVKHYGKLEEFVSLVLDMVPGLLSERERVELLLGLRARFALELCGDEPTLQIMQPHLERLSWIAESATKSGGNGTVEAAVKNIVDLLQTLLQRPAFRKDFFKGIYPLYYGPKYDTALQLLVWDFLCRLEKLLALPSFHQVPLWFEEDPSLLEDSLEIVHDDAKVQNLLQHFKDFGQLDAGPSSSSILENTILSTLSVSFTLVAVLSPCGEAEKTASTHPVAQGSINEADTCGDGSEKDGGDCLDDGDIQREENEQEALKNIDQRSQRNVTHEQKEQSVDRKNDLGSEHSHVMGNKNTEYKIHQASSGEGSGAFVPQQGLLTMPSQDPNTTPASARGTVLHACTCGEAFSLKSSLLRHKMTHSKMAGQSKVVPRILSQKAKTSGQRYECSKCRKVFRWKRAFVQHEFCHRREQSNLCSYCGKTFTVKSSLVAHIRIHTGERPYVCLICGKKFTQATALTVHKRLHTGERPYLCSVCGKGFVSSGALLIHSRYHTKNFPYMCEFCGKSFAQLQTLFCHKRFHTNERPYACTLCDKKFKNSSCLRRHMHIHTGEKPYECIQCGKRFTQRSNMRIHQRVHK